MLASLCAITACGGSKVVSAPPDDIYADGLPVPHDLTHTDGWDYLDPTKTAIQTYGTACEAIQAGSVASVTLTYGCLPP